MTELEAIQIIREAITITLMVATPPIAAGLTVGIIVSIIQTTMSIQEQTLTFVPKIVVMAVTIMLSGQWMLRVIINYTEKLYITDLVSLVK